jgi:hypothetical protein
MSSEIIQSVAYDNYDDFSTCQLHIFTKFYFTIFEDYLMTKLTLRQGIFSVEFRNLSHNKVLLDKVIQ